jgi:23S rRNA U2552 (ribose-2'-O)-methylase RlmE/FtsJ
MNYSLQSRVKGELILPNDTLFKGLNKELSGVKRLIDEYPTEWENVKKQIHEHEYIYTSSFYKKNISKVSPISRSYFKMTEMMFCYPLLKGKLGKKCVCLAEAPGGFIQFLLHSVSDKSLKIHAITLLSKNKDSKIPTWNRALLNNPNVSFHTGAKGDGDLYDLMNVLSFIKEIGKSSADLITGDGGFDYSSDYDNQERNSLKLIYSEIFVALNLQSKDGTFVCKLFDVFLKETIALIYILHQSYERVFIHKPCISRYSNSEKYIVCIGFKGYNVSLINELCRNFNENQINYPVPESFLKDIVSMNTSYVREQKSHILEGIRLIKEGLLNREPTKEQIKMAKEWCLKHDIPLNSKCFYIGQS